DYAARGGIAGARFPWGVELTPGSEHRFNVCQGRIPDDNSADVDWQSTAPADAFEPNGYGLYHTLGSVREWCADAWRGGRVIKGGSYLCHASYCNRYRLAARSENGEDAASGNAGFRMARDLA